MDNAIDIIFQIGILIFSVVIHEVSHGYAALALGDRTAKNAGRLTLNPLKHLDPVGSILLPFMTFVIPRIYGGSGFIFGWAKPVPYNPYNLKNQKWGPALVGAAGPLVNFSIAIVFGLAVRYAPQFLSGSSPVFFINFVTISGTIALLNLILAVFNFIPIPPLDGSKVLFAILPWRFRGVQLFLEQYGLFLLVLFIVFLSRLISPVVIFLFHLISGSSPGF